jgi:hypothetical protein
MIMQLPNEQQTTSAWKRTNVVNLGEFASNLQHSSIFVNLSNTPNAFVVHTSQISTITPIALGSAGIKCK